MTRPLSVLFDAHQLGRRQTGNETYIAALLAEYGTRSDVEITALLEEPAIDHPAASAFRKRQVPRSGVQRLIVMSRTARRLRPDVLHAIYFAPYLSGTRCVLTVHDISYELYPEFFSRAERLRGQTLIRDGARRAHSVITVSETSRQDLIVRYGLSPDRVFAIHNGVSQRFLDVAPREPAPVGDRPVRVLAIGTLQPRKNLPRLLDAVKLAASTRHISLRVVGPDGYQAASIRDQLDDAADVEIVGYIDDDALIEEYVNADVLAYPSIYEGFGLPVMEAMACGTPVVTSTGGSLPEVAGDAAIVVDPLDVGAIAKAILDISDDLDLRRDLVAKGRQRAAEFTWSASAARHIEVYRDASGT